MASGLFSGKVATLVKDFGAQEKDARRSAQRRRRRSSAERPRRTLTASSRSTQRRRSRELAYTVENLGAAAYLGQAPKIQSPEVLAPALAIHTVEARHAATLGTLVKKSVTPDGAFAKPAEMSTVLAAVKPFLA